MKARRFFILAAVAASLAALLFLAWKPPLLQDRAFSRAVFDRNGKLLRLTLASDETYRLYTPLKEISPQLREAVLLHEDRYFYAHAGVNPVSLARAFVRTYITGGRRVGASTLTMQLARIRYGINSRTIPGKLWQIARALQLEIHYSKDELFEAYLNLAPYGYNIEGAGAASFVYFGKKPEDLTLPEALTLAVLPQSPTRRRPESANPAKPALVQARNRLFARWLEEHPEDAGKKIFFSLPLATRGIRDLPFEAPHLVQRLLAETPKAQRITASIDLDTQHMAEDLLRHYVSDHADSGLNNASALLIDTRTMQAVASVGSADFKNAAINGQVDGTRARRSPGSALKPFIYALALDQGLIHPASILSDSPVAFGSYAPDNFERDFRGPIAARDALRLSRNVPAIRLAAQLHGPDLYDFLKQAGIGGLKDRKSYGLSLVLGGAEVTPRELAALYAMLANDGVLQRPVFRLTRDKAAPGTRLLSPEAAFITLDMLGHAPSPYAANEGMKVYWKTGTSNGFRDAWTAGVFGHYALAVWTGNFGGKSNPALIGAYAAAPLFLAIAEAVAGREPQSDLIAQKATRLSVRQVEVCATTGGLSLEDCPVKDKTWFIPGVSPIARQNIYRRVLVDARTGLRACTDSPGKTVWRTFEVWPSDLQQALQQAGINKPGLPAWQEGCDGGAAAEGGQKPAITSPRQFVEYHARIEDAEEQIPFSASADGDVRSLSWFVDNLYLGASRPGGALLWQPKPGRHQVRAVDDRGRADSVTMQVSLVQ